MENEQQMKGAISWRRRIGRYLICALACFALSIPARASEYHGQVAFGGLPLPGATATATQGSKKFIAISDDQGSYFFPDLPDGVWKIEVQMSCFATVDQDVTIAPNTPAIRFDLKLLPLDEIIAQTKIVKAIPIPVVAATLPEVPAKTTKQNDISAETPKPSEESAQPSSNGFLVNGSVNNAATSQYTLAQAFGNNRRGSKSLYTSGLAIILDNSALDARPYSISGFNLPKSAYNKITGVATFGGPINIPHLLPHGPNFFAAYEWARDSIATTQAGLMPTQAQRTSLATIDPVAQAFLTPTFPAYFPSPNMTGNSQYNYEASLLSHTHQDALQTRLDKTFGRKDEVYGNFAFESIRADSANLFNFVDTTDTLGLNGNINWDHRFNHALYENLGFQFSRLRTKVTPFFENRINVSGLAGIVPGDANITPGNYGNLQDSADWGPPTLIFSSGISSLSDANSSFNRNRTDGVSSSTKYYRGHHNVTAGGDFRRLEFNYLAQQNPRGTYTFTGAATGVSDFADFLSGKPDTSQIAYGNADKYFRQSVYDLYATDDWRLRPELTINAGLRWEYGAPITELYNRLVNLDVAPDFSSVLPVVATSPTGLVSGQHYPTSLIRPDKLGIEPRIGVSWRPIPGSSIVIRGGYGIYDDTSVYQSTALQMAQQSPLSTSVSVQYNSVNCQLTLENGFMPCPPTTPNTFAVDPNFRVGYAQTWQLAVQRDLPAALQMTATYLGIKGTHGVQEFLPNTNPIGATSVCATCQSGFIYRSSNGNSDRESFSLQLRRRLRSGFTATAQYTYSRSTDDDSVLGGQGPVAAGAASQTLATPSIAQDWRNLNAERGPSTFDQRHLLNASFQYTTGMGLGGGTLLTGWRGRIYKEWTVLGQIVAGSGLPETPSYLATVTGTGQTGPIRPDRTTASLYSGSPGRFLNPAAYSPPQPDQWGNAGRDSISGPGQFTFNASLARTFRLTQRFNLDIRVDANNVFNHVVFTNWNTALNPVLNGSALPFTLLLNPLFGLPASANSMRSLQTTARLRF
jgi:hypothetical protein